MTGEISNHGERRGLAAAFALCALVTLTLLASHPSSGARSFAEFVQDEARHVLIDGLVHGGFIVTLSALIVCFVLLSQRLGSGRAPIVIGLSAYCIGSGALMLSMILDGFATPAIATRFADTASADNLATAKTLLILCGTLIRFLMPLGMLFQFAAMLSWSAVIANGPGLRRAVGAYGVVAAMLFGVALVAVPAAAAAHVLLGGIALQAIWYLALAGLLASRNPWP